MNRGGASDESRDVAFDEVTELLDPVESSTSLNGQVHAKLRELILTARLRPGTRLRPAALAEALDVSPTPIREALLRLQEEGLVEASRRRWTRVAVPDPELAAQAYPIIGALEAFALSEVSAPDRGLIRSLRRANETLRKAARSNDVLGCMEADTSFHAILMSLSSNEILLQLLVDLKARIRLLEGELYRSAWGLSSAAEHDVIIQALEEKDVPKAVTALVDNWRHAGSAVVQALGSAAEPSAGKPT